MIKLLKEIKYEVKYYENTVNPFKELKTNNGESQGKPRAIQ